MRPLMNDSKKSSHFQALSLETALESFMDGVVIIDSEMRVTYSNQAAKKICQKVHLPSDLNWSKHFGIFFADSKKLCPTEKLPILRALRGEEVRDELLFLNNEKMKRGHFVSCNARPVYHHDVITGAIMSFRVVTEILEKERKHEEERKHFEAEKRKMEASFQMATLGGVLAELGHEIKNPLTGISSANWLLKRMLSANPIPVEDMTAQIENIQMMVDKVDGIVKSVRNASRNSLLDSCSSQPFDEILKDALNICFFRLKGIKVEVSQDSQEEVFCSRVQFCQVLVNLISNAADAVEHLPDPWIRISVQGIGEKLVIRIEDSGDGVPESVEEKAFSPFFTTKEFGRGTGLGLSLSRKYVENLSGKLSINRSVSASCFEITLPQMLKAKKVA
jgi:C4-dicarboxylate-specific signal transduction histidine kinase